MTFDLPRLIRPQYPSSPEVLLSSLAWSVVPRNPDSAEVGLIYQRKESKANRGVRISQTMPKGDMLEAFRASLESQGVKSGDGHLPLMAAEAISNALLGARRAKGVGQASSAIGLASALLQDPRGGLATHSPPKFGKLLNTMYALGGAVGDMTAAGHWFDAALHYAEGAKLKELEAALASTVLQPYLTQGQWPPAVPSPADNAAPDLVPGWWRRDVIESGLGTPFSWFTKSWDHLCSREWYEVLPPQRWAGWAICVLRNAIGFTFLWEANFFLELAKGILDRSQDQATAARWALSPTKPLVPYQRGGIAQMDVGPSIRRLLKQGLSCRNAIIGAAEGLHSEPVDLPGFIGALRETDLAPIRAAMSGGQDPGGLSNLVETVRYSLVARDDSDFPDHYALLKRVSRNYTHVAPAPEWIVVMSAVAASKPTDVVRLGDVRRSLEDIGFKPRIDFLLGELERAGLCASASDGDEGIEINLGFGRN